LEIAAVSQKTATSYPNFFKPMMLLLTFKHVSKEITQTLDA